VDMTMSLRLHVQRMHLMGSPDGTIVLQDCTQANVCSIGRRRRTNTFFGAVDQFGWC
jgi:hypothetical protein